jgi:hypothetical protein
MSATEKTNCPIYLHDQYLRKGKNKEFAIRQRHLNAVSEMSFHVVLAFYIDFYSSCSVELNFECVIISFSKNVSVEKVQYTESTEFGAQNLRSNSIHVRHATHR